MQTEPGSPADPAPLPAGEHAHVDHLPVDGLIAADALEEAHREVPDRPWGRVALMTLIISALLMTGWELFWRHQGYEAGDIKNTPSAWAEQRRRAEGDATVLIGTSRNLFDVNLDNWQKVAGVRPVQLSIEGSNPRLVLTDLANDQHFHGLVISDVVAGQFYPPPGVGRAGRALDYYRHETPSQILGRWLVVPFEEVFAYIDDQTRPKTLWAHVALPTRPGQRPYLDVYKIGVSKADRNSKEWDREVWDQAYRERSIRIWGIIETPDPHDPPLQPAKVNAEVAQDVAKIRARGGDVVFVAHPCAGVYAEHDRTLFPRDVYWFPLLKATGSIGVHYLDHPELQGFRIPEISHMHPDDSPIYTERLARIVMAKLAARKAGGR